MSGWTGWKCCERWSRHCHSPRWCCPDSWRRETGGRGVSEGYIWILGAFRQLVRRNKCIKDDHTRLKHLPVWRTTEKPTVALNRY